LCYEDNYHYEFLYKLNHTPRKMRSCLVEWMMTRNEPFVIHQNLVPLH